MNDILQDDRRATEVIRRMRSLLKKAPFELKQSRPQRQSFGKPSNFFRRWPSDGKSNWSA